MSVVCFSERWALRIRVSMSAIGSVIGMGTPLPARLDQAGATTVKRDQPQLAARNPELAVDAARAPGERAAVPQPHRRGIARQLLQLFARGEALFGRQLRVVRDLEQLLAPGGVLLHGLAALLFAVDDGSLGHTVVPRNDSGSEREAEGGEERLRLVVGSRGGSDSDVHAADRVDLVVLDLGENDLFLDAHVVVAAAIEGARRDAAEVADARHRDADQAVEELVHAAAAQRDLAADRVASADLVVRHRGARLGDQRFLPGDLGHVGQRVVHDLLVRHRLAHAHVEHDLLDARHLHRALVAELLHQLLDYRLAIVDLQARHRRGPLGLLLLLLLLLLRRRRLLRFRSRPLLGLAFLLRRGLLPALLRRARVLRPALRVLLLGFGLPGRLRVPGFLGVLGVLTVSALRHAHASITSPLDLKYLTRRPSCNTLMPIRSAFLVAGL